MLALRRPRPTASGTVLIALIAAGIAVRIVACLALWPVTTTLSDAGNYALHAATSPLTDPQHPPGYSALVALLGLVTRQVAVVVLAQHALGVAAALLLFCAVRRITGSAWPALVPAAVVLLDSDEVFLEHSIMSEGPFLFLMSLGLYAAVRTVDSGATGRCRWVALAALALTAAAVLRSAGLFAIPIVATSMLVTRAGGGRRWAVLATFTVLAVAGLATTALLTWQATGRLALGPATGWHLYARVGRFADCRRFRPPPGTRGLCERVPPSQRGWGPDFYMYAPASPARRLFGRIGSHDAAVGAFALQVILHQPRRLLATVAVDDLRYFVPAARPHGWYAGWDLDPQLDWSRLAGPAYARDLRAQMLTFFASFTERRRPALIDGLSAYQSVFGFGGTALTVASLLSVLGLVGARRNRLEVLIFAGAGLAMLLLPTFTVLYTGRYLVPVAGPIAAGAAIACAGLRHALAAHCNGALAYVPARRENRRAVAFLWTHRSGRPRWSRTV